MAADALVFESEATEPAEVAPPDFPYWEHVTQRNYWGPTVIYLGGGWALTARHVGMGEIMFDGLPHPARRGSEHTLLNQNGYPADAMVFELKRDVEAPDLMTLPIARDAPQVGEEVLMIGFGRLRKEIIESNSPDGPQTAFTWTERGEKRWGTNRIELVGRRIYHERFDTASIIMRFDGASEPNATPHEASATLGDSGGAIFANRDGEWQLVGLITSITRLSNKPGELTTIGDFIYAADLSQYRGEILRWARSGCSNEIDDDGDGDTDYPDDANCESANDLSERPEPGALPVASKAILGALAAGLIVLSFVIRERRQRSRRMPDSTSSSSAR
jgi:hypothetical protein